MTDGQDGEVPCAAACQDVNKLAFSLCERALSLFLRFKRLLNVWHFCRGEPIGETRTIHEDEREQHRHDDRRYRFKNEHRLRHRPALIANPLFVYAGHLA